MEPARRRRKPIIIIAAAFVILCAVLCFGGCGAGQNSAGGQNSQTTPNGLHKEEMARLCYYRPERDENFDADMEILEGRISALTDGNYLKEDTELVYSTETLDAVSFYVPKEVYGERSLRDLSRILINRPMNFWLAKDNGVESRHSFTEKIEFPRDAIESVELTYGRPESFNPLDYGMMDEEYYYLTITLSEEYSRTNPQIWEWQQPFILQDIEGYQGYAYISLIPDAENRCMILSQDKDQGDRAKSYYYSLTHEPLSDAFYLVSVPVVEWESGEEIKGAGQIENDEFKTSTAVYEYAPTEENVSDKNWEQTLQAIRERLDSTGLPYALGHRPGIDRSIVIRIERGLFSDNFMDYVVQKTAIQFSGCGESLVETPSSVKASALDQSGQKVLSLDMSALRKETFYKLSTNCVKAGGGRIILKVNETVVAYGYCDRVINDGKFVMDCNAITAEDEFVGEMKCMPDFLAALISGTQIPIISSYKAAVTLQNMEEFRLNEEGEPCITNNNSISKEKLYDRIRSGIGDLDYVNMGLLENGKPVLQFALPEGETRNEQIAAVMSRVFQRLRDEIFTYWMRFDFVDGNGESVLVFVMREPTTGSKTSLSYLMVYDDLLTEEDEAEISKILTEDASLAGLAIAE